MQLTLANRAGQATRRISTLNTLSAAAVVGIALVISGLSLAFFGFDLGPAVIIVLCLIFAGLVFTGWRWTPLLSVLPGVGLPATFGMLLLAEGSGPLFLGGLLIVGFGITASVCGVAATVQNYRHSASERFLPRWIVLIVVIITGIVTGAYLSTLVPRPATSAGVSREMLATLPGLSAHNFAFSQAEVRVKLGETVALRLENGDSANHSFDIDELNVHAPIPTGQTSLALFKPTKPGTYTFYCAPHYDKASGQGMHGSLIVEP